MGLLVDAAVLGPESNGGDCWEKGVSFRLDLLESLFDDAGALRPEAIADWAAHSEAADIEQYLKEAAI